MWNSILEEVDREDARAKDDGVPWRVFFICADLSWFGQVKRDLECLQPNWLCLHVAGVEALETAEWRSANALMVDGNAAGAREWLEKLKKERPEINCLIRCDVSEKASGDKSKELGFPTLATQSDASALASSL